MATTVDEILKMVTTKSHHPWLVMYDSKKPETQILFSISKHGYYTRNMSELCNKGILCYCMDWLVIVDYDKSEEISLLNVMSMEKLVLPKIVKPFYVRSRSRCCSLSCGDGRLVFIDGLSLTVSFCQQGDSFTNKKIILLPKEQQQVGAFLSSAICFNGNIIYGLLVARPSLSLVECDLNDPTSRFQTVLNGKSEENELVDDGDCTSYHLTESCGELLLVIRYLLHERASCIFQVLRPDFASCQWVFLRSIGDRAIFLDSFSLHGISCLASKSGILGNRIYYTVSGATSLYVFSLEDRSLTMTIVLPTFAALFYHGFASQLHQLPGLQFDPRLLSHGEHYIEVYKSLPSNARVKQLF